MRPSPDRQIVDVVLWAVKSVCGSSALAGGFDAEMAEILPRAATYPSVVRKKWTSCGGNVVAA